MILFVYKILNKQLIFILKAPQKNKIYFHGGKLGLLRVSKVVFDVIFYTRIAPINIRQNL